MSKRAFSRRKTALKDSKEERTENKEQDETELVKLRRLGQENRVAILRLRQILLLKTATHDRPFVTRIKGQNRHSRARDGGVACGQGE